MVPIGIRPTNDFAFKKTFGTPSNKLALVSLLNAILELRYPIVEVTLENPFNLQDFKDDKLSILDIRAVDERGAIYDIEMQLSIFAGLVKRIVFYGCEIYADQLRNGDNYTDLKPVYAICLLEDVLWPDSAKVHHAFRLEDRDSGRILEGTLEFHTLELGWYNLREEELGTASELDRWLFWLLHAHQYDPYTLDRLFPHPPFRQATDTITRIAKITEDKAMYDTREKAIRDQQWALNAAREEARAAGRLEGRQEGREEGRQEGREEGRQEGRQEGREEGRQQGREEGLEQGEIKLIQTLQDILGLPVSDAATFQGQSLLQLQALTAELRHKVQRRS